MSVADMLACSATAHERATVLRKDKSLEAHASMVLAAQYRMDAHAADPTHSDPAWGTLMGKRAGKSPTAGMTHNALHERLLAFYREKGAL